MALFNYLFANLTKIPHWHVEHQHSGYTVTVSMEWRQLLWWYVIQVHYYHVQVRNEFPTLNDAFYFIWNTAPAEKHLAECHTQLRSGSYLLWHHIWRWCCFILFKRVNWVLLSLYYYKRCMCCTRLGKERGVYRKSKGSVPIVLSSKDFAMSKSEPDDPEKLARVSSRLQEVLIHLEFWNIEAKPLFTKVDFRIPYQDFASLWRPTATSHKVGTIRILPKMQWGKRRSHSSLFSRRKLSKWNKFPTELCTCPNRDFVDRIHFGRRRMSVVSPCHMVTNKNYRTLGVRTSSRHHQVTRQHAAIAINVFVILWVRYNWHDSHNCLYSVNFCEISNMDVIFFDSSRTLWESDVRRCDASLQKGWKSPDPLFSQV